MDIKAGNYSTKGGYKAHVYKRGKDFMKRDCWVGTIEGIGMSTWGDDGKDLSGSESLDIVESKRKKGKRNECS